MNKRIIVDKQKIVLASGNKGKCAEIQALLNHLPIELIPQDALNIPEIEETGLTFIENAILKARNAARFSGLPALADDSGLTVDCLNGAPGVRSARYAGPGASNMDLIHKLLTEIAQVGGSNHHAQFHCVLALLNSSADPAPIICHGIWEGEILPAPRGKQGFGYDPLFYVPSHHCSAAEMNLMEKNRISHRGQASTKLIETLTKHKNILHPI